MTADELAMIKARARNTLQHIPEHVDANDKLRLIAEIERLQAAVEKIGMESWMGPCGQLARFAGKAAEPLTTMRI